MVDNTVNTGTVLEASGWRQGSVVKRENIASLYDNKFKQLEGELVLIVASQSCDIANNDLENDPFIELSVGRIIESQKGHLTFNKNPRILHTELFVKTQDAEIYQSTFIELIAYKKIQIEKKNLIELSPDESKIFADSSLAGYVAWLVARYSRPALPTTFNDRLTQVDPKNKRKKKAKSLNHLLLGIYVEIIPDTEIPNNQNYKVNLLGLVAADFTDNLTDAETIINDYAEIMKKARMDVSVAIMREDQVSIAMIKRFKRFYYDDLSFRSNTSLPPETQTNI